MPTATTTLTAAPAEARPGAGPAPRPGLAPWLRAEGLALLLGAVAARFAWHESWWPFVAALFVVDLSLVGYAFGPRVGALAHNAAHATPGPALLLALGWGLGSDLAAAAALGWFAHVGLDRALGFGLKEAASFRRTHLGEISLD